MMIAERPAVGIQKKAEVKPYRATITTTAVTTPARGVRTPDLDLRAERENDPVAGYAPKAEPIVLVTPMAINS